MHVHKRQFGQIEWRRIETFTQIRRRRGTYLGDNDLCVSLLMSTDAHNIQLFQLLHGDHQTLAGCS